MMNHSYHEILNPVGKTATANAAGAVSKVRNANKPVIGLLNNSKPNVDFFLAAIEREILSRPAAYEILNIVKSRSAGPCADIEQLAERCDYVINAVAD